MAQNAQPIAQPTWELTQTTYLRIFRPVQERNANGLERLGAVAAKQILGESILRRDNLVQQGQVRNDRQPADLVKHGGGDALGRRRKLAAPHGRRMNLPRLSRRHADVRQAGVQLFGSAVCQENRHQESSVSNSSTIRPNCASALSTLCGFSMSTPAPRSKSNGSLEQPPLRNPR